MAPRKFTAKVLSHASGVDASKPATPGTPTLYAMPSMPPSHPWALDHGVDVARIGDGRGHRGRVPACCLDELDRGVSGRGVGVDGNDLGAFAGEQQ
jgi:hypothetical protein